MGCCNEKLVRKDPASSFIISEEEEFFKDFEKKIPFASASIGQLTVILKQFKKVEMLNRPQVNFILRNLGFNDEELTDPDSFVYKLVAMLKGDGKLYLKEKVFATALILASGSSFEKAEALFEIFDRSNFQIMQRNDLKRMVQELFNIAVLDLPLIAINDGFENQNSFHVNQEKFEKHLRFLQERKDFFVNRLLNRILEGEEGITQKKFVSKVKNDPVVESLVWSFMIRLTLLD